MSFAVIQTGGKQYKVKSGEILKIERLEDSKPESKVEFKEILAYGDYKNIELGEPIIAGAKVQADLIKNGHRQQYSLIKIKKIFAKDGAILSEAKKVEKSEIKKIKEEKK